MKDIIGKYKSKLQNDKINILYFFKKDNKKVIFPDKKLEDVGIKNLDNIYAVYEEEEEKEEEKVDKKEEMQKNKTNKKDQISKDKLNKIIKEKMNKGLIPIIIFNPRLGSKFYFVLPNVKFQTLADLFENDNKEKKWFFLYEGNVISPEKTLEELKIKKFAKIIAEELTEELPEELL